MRAKYKKYTFLPMVLILLIVLVPLKAQALGLLPVIIGVGVTAAISYIALPGLTNEVGQAIISLIDVIVNGFLGFLIILFGNLINAIIPLQNFLLKIDAVEETWKIFRDLANMFFILLLVVTAFATIFDVPKYKVRELLPKIIIAALLINFSFVIFQATVDILWLPATMFLNAIGNPQEVGTHLGEPLKAEKIITAEFAPKTETEAETLGGKLIFTLMKALLFVSILFALGWIGLVLLVRIPVLIGLAIISPIAWLSYAFPAARDLWRKWWEQVINWGIIPFFYLGVIYFVLLFNSRIGAFLESESAQFQGAISGFWPLAFNTTILMFINLGLLIGGLYYAHSFAAKSGTFGYGWSGSLLGATGVTGGVRKWWGKVTGALGEAREAREEKVAEKLARITPYPKLRPTYPEERTLLDQAEKANKDIDNKLKRAVTTEDELKIINELKNAVKEGAKGPEILAAVTNLAKKGQLDKELFGNALKQFENMPLILTKVFSEWKEGKFGGLASPEELLGVLKDLRVPLEAKRIGYNFIASDDGKKVVEKMKHEDYKIGYEILGRGATKDGREFKKNIGKQKPTVVAEYTLNNLEKEVPKEEDRAKYLDEEGKLNLKNAIREQIKVAGVKDIADYNRGEWDDDKFRTALKEIIQSKEGKEAGWGRKFTIELRRRLRRESKDEQFEKLNEISREAGMGPFKEAVLVEEVEE